MTGTHYHSIQTLRAIAALIVAVMHATVIWETAPPLYIPIVTNAASLGVYLFFAISGFIIAERIPFESNLIRYLLRRYMRVLPLSILATGAAVGISWALNGNTVFTAHVSYDGQYDPGPFYILQSMFMLPMDDWPYLLVTWSLPFEIIFYVTFGATALILNQRIGTMLFVLGAGWLWLRSGVSLSEATNHYPHRSLYLYFAFGLLAREWLQWKPGPVLPAVLAAMGLAAIIAATEFSFYLGNLYILVTGVGFMGLIVLIASLERDGRLFTRPTILTWLGDISFSLYMVHLLVINTTAFFFRGDGITPATAEVLRLMTVIGSIAVATLVYTTFERPVNAVAKRQISRIGRKNPERLLQK